MTIDGVFKLYREEGHTAVTNYVRLLVKNRSPDAAKVLFICEWSENLALLDAVLRAGPDVNVVNRIGQSPLYIAASVGFRDEERAQVDVCRKLIAAGANVNLQHVIRHQAPPMTLEGETALMSAARTDSVVIAEVLILNGADPRIRDKRGFTALDYAVRRGSKRVAALLGGIQDVRS